MLKIAEFLNSLHNKGIRLWLEDGSLLYRAPRGSLSATDAESLRELKADILAFLEHSSLASNPLPQIERRERSQVAPLTYSQQYCWNVLRLPNGPSMREVATAIRIVGPLNSSLLQLSFAKLSERHEVLQTRIAEIDGSPAQVTDDTLSCELELIRFAPSQTDSCEARAKRFAEDIINQTVNLASDPLCVAYLLQVSSQDHVLLVAMDHLIADGDSLHLLLRDLWILYLQGSGRYFEALPKIEAQFSDYALWQQQHQLWWTKESGGYWTTRMEGAPRVRFSQRTTEFTCNTPVDALPIAFGKDQTDNLRALARAQKVSLSTVALTAYTLATLTWCNSADIVIRFVTNGRHHVAIQNTIGFFASILHLRVRLGIDDSFLTLLSQVETEFLLAHKHDDCMRLSAQVPRPDFTLNTLFNWRTDANRIPLPELHTAEGTIHLMPFPLPIPGLANSPWESEPSIILSDSSEGISGSILFRSDYLTRNEMASFIECFALLTQRITVAPGCSLSELMKADRRRK